MQNRRERVISNDEWVRLVSALRGYGNPYAVPALTLLLETTMRSSEPLLRARWCDVDFKRSVLHLPDAKTGARDVPLNPVALGVLERLKVDRGTVDPDAPLLPTSYEALKKAWRVACAQAGVDAAKIHDLRHTGATRYAIQFNGNVPVLQQITGHRTVHLLMRYIHIRVDDVVRMLHGRPMDEGTAPAGLRLMHEKDEVAVAPSGIPSQLPANVVRFPSKRRAA
jgi:integrase